MELSKEYLAEIDRKNAELEAKWEAHFKRLENPIESRLSQLIEREQGKRVVFRESSRLDTLCAMER